jgi:hypothetical protein
MTLDERLKMLERAAPSFRVSACIKALRALVKYYAEPSEDAEDPAGVISVLEEQIR